MSHCSCGCLPCQCVVVKKATTTIKFTPVLEVENSFIIPDCGDGVNIDLKKITALLVGGNLWSPDYGYFEITSFDAISGKANIRNNCVDGNAAPGTVVPEDAKFLLTAPLSAIDDSDVTSLSVEGESELTGDITLSAGDGIALTQAGQNIEVASNLSLVVGEGDCLAPGSGNMIRELSLSGGVLTIIGAPEHELGGADLYQTNFNVNTYEPSPQFDITLSPDETEYGPLLTATLSNGADCRYIFYTATVDLYFELTNNPDDGNDFIVEIQKRVNGGSWVTIQRDTRWLFPGLQKQSNNMHRTFIDAFNPQDGAYVIEFRASFYSSNLNTLDVLVNNVIMTASILTSTNEVIPV